MRLKIKNKSFELVEGLDIVFKLKEMGAEFVNGVWVVESRIKNFKFLISNNIVKNINDLKLYYNSLLQAKIKEKNGLSNKYPYLYNFQVKIVDKIVNCKYKGFLNSSDAGLGKTLISLVVMQELKADKIVIICPATLKHQWREEIWKWFKDDNVTVIEGGVTKRQKLYQNKSRYYIISYETYRNDVDKFIELRRILNRAYVISDECQKLKNRKSLIWKKFNKYNKIFKYRLFLTATPLTNKLHDFHNLIKLIDKNIIGGISKYCVYEEQEFGWGWNKKIVPVLVGYTNLKEYVIKIDPVYYRVNKKDVATELPDRTYINIKVEQDKKYLKIKENIINQIGIFSGFSLLSLLDTGFENLVKSESESVELLKDSFPKNIINNKLNILHELLEDIGDNQVLIFTHYINSATTILNYLKTKIKNKIIKTSNQEDKDKLRNEFNNGEIDILIVTDKFSSGVSFPAIDYMINYDIIPNLETWYQRNERIYRINSKNNKTIYNLIGNVIEHHIFNILQQKLKLFNTVVEGQANKIDSIDIMKEVINNFY